MPTKTAVKKFVVDYKPVKILLKKKKAELERLQKKVSLAAKLDLQLQIKAMELLISQCKNAKMSKGYDGA